jgi:ABC-type nitrate/sulfonate/bicarbonate transport system substrate-binding protein
LKGWIEATCSGIKPNYIVIAGSPNRYAALLADQIDASPLELADAVRLEGEASDRFHLLANLNETQKLPTTLYTNPDWASQNPGTVQAFLQALIEENRKIASQQGYLAQLVTKYMPKTEKINETAARYVQTGIFDVNGELNESVAKGILDFDEKYGFTKPGLALNQVFDLSYLNAVLDRIGRK